jgi:3-deoxy-D-manno-octulosonic-acid transferase
MEPSVAGVPTIFGPKYHDFDEASEIINNKSGFSIKKGTEFIEILDQFINNDQKRILASQVAQELVNNNAGASNKIVREILSN